MKVLKIEKGDSLSFQNRPAVSTCWNLGRPRCGHTKALHLGGLLPRLCGGNSARMWKGDSLARPVATLSTRPRVRVKTNSRTDATPSVRPPLSLLPAHFCGLKSVIEFRSYFRSLGDRDWWCLDESLQPNGYGENWVGARSVPTAVF